MSSRNKTRSLEIGKPLGSGSFGSVYRASIGPRIVAVKMWHVDVARAQGKAIQQETDILESLRNKHILEFYGTTVYDNNFVLVTEFAEGGSLEDAIKHKRLDESLRIRIWQETAMGLRFLHSKNVLHRDLKSANVLLTEYMHAKISDFGFATIKASDDKAFVGTIRWMAPELHNPTPVYSNKSDVFALGMVMWEMVAGCTTPYKNLNDNFSVAKLVQSGKREEIPKGTPEAYKQWIERCWSQDPAKRPEARDMIVKDNKLLTDLIEASERLIIKNLRAPNPPASKDNFENFIFVFEE